jgi:trans-aconitate methyltransferase
MNIETMYDTTEGVEEYTAMAVGYDGRIHVERLVELLPPGSDVLELGIGPGVDLDMLAEIYQVVGSDRSQAFLDRYAQRRTGAVLLRLDAITIETDRTFDAIYSNKVLHHLTVDEMCRSLERQAQLIRPGGLLMHGLWAGTETEQYQGLHVQNYTCETLAAVLPSALELVECDPYAEMDEDDSIRVVLQVRPDAVER